MKNTISLNKYLLIGVIVGVMALGAYGGWYFTNNHYQTAEDKRLADEERHNRDNVLCSTEVMRGNAERLRAIIIFSSVARNKRLAKYINYNVPDDTETVWMGFKEQ